MKWFLLLFVSQFCFSANRYWVGAAAGCNGTWADTDCWSATSNGAGAAGVPGAADDVFFDGVGNGASNSTLGANITINSLDMTGYANTLTHSAGVTLTHDSSGIFRFSAGMTYTLGNATSSQLSFTSTSGTTQITTAGKTIGNITFNGAGGTFQLQDSITGGSSQILTLTAGTLDTNNQTINVSRISTNNSNTRTLTLGSSQITLNRGSGDCWESQSVTNLTMTLNTSTVTLTGNSCSVSSAVKDFNGMGLVVATGNTLSTANSTFKNVSFTGTASKTNFLALGGGITVTETFSANGNSAANRIIVRSDTIGTARTITAANVSFSNVDFRDITGAGAASWNLSSITGNSGDALGNSGITFTSSQTQYWTGNGGSWDDATQWCTTSGGCSDGAGNGRVPLPQDDTVFDNGSFSGTSQTVSQNNTLRMGRSMDWSAYNEGQTPTFSAPASWELFGSLTLNSGMTFTSNGTFTNHSRGVHTITNAGKTFNNAFTVATPGGTLTLQDALSATAMTLTAGTFNANGFNVTGTTFSGSGTLTRTLTMGNGTWEITSTGSGAWTLSTTTNLTFNSNSSTVRLSNTTGTSKTFAGGGQTYNNVEFSGQNITVSGNNTFSSMAINNGAYTTGLLLTAGSTQTITTSLTTNGSLGLLAKSSSTVNGTRATINASGAVGNICVDYVNIKDINATGGASFYAGLNSTNGGGNTGWSFTECPTGGATFPFGIINNPVSFGG